MLAHAHITNDRTRRLVKAEGPAQVAGGPAREEFLTQGEVAALLKVPVRTVERWQHQGLLPFLRIGHTIRFHWPTVVNHLLAKFSASSTCQCVPHMTQETLKPEI